jgi:hypothetical protein
MVRRQKLISMTDHHFEVAAKMPNFSKWVRERMNEYIQNAQDQKETRKYVCSKCEVVLDLERIQNRIKGNYFTASRWCFKCNDETMVREDLV